MDTISYRPSLTLPGSRRCTCGVGIAPTFRHDPVMLDAGGHALCRTCAEKKRPGYLRKRAGWRCALPMLRLAKAVITARIQAF